MRKKGFLKISSAQIIPLGFFALILFGTVMLLLPISTAPGESTSLLTALFTSTTSVCVTGLVVTDTFAHWSLFGQIVILVLIQLGGLGVITVYSAFILTLHKRMALKDQILLMDAFNLSSLDGLLVFLGRVLRGTFIVEGAGALMYLPAFIPRFGIVRGIWVSVFTSISAFCNAGIDIIGPDSLMGFKSDPLVLITTMLLIVLGGIGYIVWFDLLSNLRRRGERKRRISEHTKLVLFLTAALILFGAASTFALEYSNPATLGGMSLGDKILNSFFQSVTFRTAGFATFTQKGLTESSALIGAVLMFIGGSPVGTAGGVKTVTFYVILKNTMSFVLNRNETIILRRRVNRSFVQEATAILTTSLTVVFLFTVLVCATNKLSLTDGLYEVVSATATVGLTRDLTPQLNRIGRVFIIICMYLGRIGPISLALFFRMRHSPKNNVSISEGKFIVG